MFVCVVAIRMLRGHLAEAHELAMQTKEIHRLSPIVSARAELAWLAGRR